MTTDIGAAATLVASRTPRVAVIAIHGVADQKPDESNGAVAGLLARRELDAGKGSHYSTFSRRQIEVPLTPVRVAQRSPTDDEPTRQTRGTGHASKRPVERREYLIKADHRERDPDWELGYQFMRMQLEGYEPGSTDRVYETTVLEATRTASAGDTDVRDVDVFEVHWADLSRLATGPLAFVGSLYQILLHLATLGRQAVDDAADENQTKIWRLLAFSQQWAVRMLTLPIPMLNVVLLVSGVGLMLADLAIGPAWARKLGVGLIVAPIVGGVLYRYGRNHVAGKPARWSLLPLATAIIAWGVAELIVWNDVIPRSLLVAVVWWLLGLVATWYVAHAYEVMRPRATRIALLGYAIAAAGFFYFLLFAHGPSMLMHPRGSIELAALYTIQMLFALLRISWIVVFFFALMLVALWPIARLTTRYDDSKWARGRAALRTGRLTLALSAGAFLIVTIVAWSGIFSYGVEKFGTFKATSPTQLVSITSYVTDKFGPFKPGSLSERGLTRLQTLVPDPVALARLDSLTAADSVDASRQTTPEYLQGMIAESLTGAAPLSLVATALAFLVLVWMAIPSIRAEQIAPSRCRNAESRMMGWWLSRGLDSTRLVTHLLFMAAFGLPLLVKMFVAPDGSLARGTYMMVGTVGAFVAAFAVVIVGTLIKVGGTAIDIVLDVDNYLRTTPAHSAPRARICERYVSLLRHLASDDEHGRPRYDHVIVVAHSLGALISAELFHFLATANERGAGDPTLARFGYGPGTDVRIPISLMTMGNPLRQLINRFFPHRYRWVRAAPDNGSRSLRPETHHVPTSTDSARPTARTLGIARWENAYRSGDYVGRTIWLQEWFDRTDTGDDRGAYPEPLTVWSPLTTDETSVVAEYCIGSGGHLHYWDRTAPDIADRLDLLIGSTIARRDAR